MPLRTEVIGLQVWGVVVLGVVLVLYQGIHTVLLPVAPMVVVNLLSLADH